MATLCLLPASPLPAAGARPPAARVIPSAVRYEGRPRSRATLVIALTVSAALHAGILFGSGHMRKKTPPPAPAPFIQLAITFPELKELEEPEVAPNNDDQAKPDLGAPVPMQADVPRPALPNDFVQKLDFSSLIERPDLSQAKVFAVPEHIGRAGKIRESIGNIFNLSDLDRVPEALFQPAPIPPSAMRREGLDAIVHIEFVVDVTGSVVNAIVVQTSDLRFNEAALAGVARWKFRAGIRGGRKVNTRMYVPIHFVMKDVVID